MSGAPFYPGGPPAFAGVAAQLSIGATVHSLIFLEMLTRARDRYEHSYLVQGCNRIVQYSVRPNTIWQIVDIRLGTEYQYSYLVGVTEYQYSYSVGVTEYYQYSYSVGVTEYYQYSYSVRVTEYWGLSVFVFGPGVTEYYQNIRITGRVRAERPQRGSRAHFVIRI